MLSSRRKACSKAINYQRASMALERGPKPQKTAEKLRGGEEKCHCICGKCPCGMPVNDHPSAAEPDYPPGQKPCPLGLMRALTASDVTASRRRNSSRAVSWIAKYAGTRAVRSTAQCASGCGSQPPLTSHFQVEDVESGLQSELCKQRWLLNLIGGVESSYQDTILDLHEERVRL